MTGESERRRSAGLWSFVGDGVLSRQGDLILLSSLTEDELLEQLLGLLADVASAGGDGRQFTDEVEHALGKSLKWTAGGAQEPGPSVVAFGPAGAGLAITVSGTAWAEITTTDGPQQLTGQPLMLLRCTLGSPLLTVRGGLTPAVRDQTGIDPFSRLDGGTIRAGGLVFRASGRSPRTRPPSTGGSGLVRDAEPAPEPIRDEAEEQPGPILGEEPEEAPDPVLGEVREEDSDLILGEEPGEADASASAQASGPDQERGPQFEAVVLSGTLGEAEPRPPLPVASARRDETTDLSVAPVILGVYCKNGHFDDPEARYCAVCGISMSQRTLVPQPGPRPPLGVLVLDDGTVFQLDADYIIGREPERDAAVAAGQVRPLRIADRSGIVSRVHAQVNLQDWQVLVTDLGAANGTKVRPPGEGAEQLLIPQIPTPLRPGSYVDLGGLGFRYESHRGR